MNKEEARKNFTAESHAMLFAWIAKAAIEKVGENKAGPALTKAVIRYGEQRGKRMAMRAKANHHPLDMLGYLAYGEWKAGKGEMQMLMSKELPNLRVKVPKCSWFTAWSAAGLTQYGKYYCQDIDVAVMHGFNPELKLEVGDIKPEGKQECDMLFHNARLGPSEMLTMSVRKMFKPGRTAIMSWDYHTGHVYKTMKEVLMEELGPAGEEAINQAMAEFSKRYGADAAQIVREYQDVDFNVLPVKKA
jgi:hypothetical protein